MSQIYTVSQVNQYIKGLLDRDRLLAGLGRQVGTEVNIDRRHCCKVTLTRPFFFCRRHITPGQGIQVHFDSCELYAVKAIRFRKFDFHD